MATGPRIVHKQFNSPIGLYSQHNIKETLNKHLSNLDNGTVGIDFSNPATDKPTNLANSAVLRMLEEEERNRRGYPSQKKVVWPPVPETNGYHSSQQSQYQNSAQHSPSYRPAPAQSPQPQYHQQPQHQSQPQYQQQSQNQHQSQPQYQHQTQPQHQAPQSQPAHCEGRRQEACGLSKLIPVGPGVTASHAPPKQGPLSPVVAAQPYRPGQGRWAPVTGPLSPQGYGSQPNYQQQQSPQPQYSPQSQQYSPQTQQYSPQPQQYSPQPQYEAYQPPQRQFEPPPSTITLRQHQPIHQKPPPVFQSQPATHSFQGGVNMRGDQKWPPQSVREAVEAENEARRMLAKGPACRPRKVKKDYSGFFAQHSLNNNYPGYRAPPGTQHYEDHSGRSSY